MELALTRRHLIKVARSVRKVNSAPLTATVSLVTKSLPVLTVSLQIRLVQAHAMSALQASPVRAQVTPLLSVPLESSHKVVKRPAMTAQLDMLA